MPTEKMEFKGMPLKAGKLVQKSGKYVLTVGAVKKELPAGLNLDEKQLARLVGDVNVATSGRNIVAILSKKVPPRGVVCYIPTPDFLKSISEKVRQSITDELLSNKIVTPEFVAGLKR